MLLLQLLLMLLLLVLLLQLMLERFNHSLFDHLLPNVGRVQNERYVEHFALQK